MRRAFPAVLAASLVTGSTLATPAWANPLKSLYTTLELSSCKVERRHPDGNAWLCAGLDGYPVRVAEGDQRTFVSVGRDPEQHRAVRQSLATFNSIFDAKHGRATLEWRIVRQNGQPVPFATILRYFTSKGALKGEVLVVTRLAPGQSCHVAYIDALANPDAIAIARKTADAAARTFDCKREPDVKGQRGKTSL